MSSKTHQHLKPMTASERPRADDYLRAFSKERGERWFDSLIDEILRTHRIPSKVFMEKVFNDLIVANGLKEKQVDSSANEIVETAKEASGNGQLSTGGFLLKSLTHEAGVNALTKGATIPFHPKLTVIYGKNATGKSGFVRILKRLGNSQTQEDVWQNVHATKSRNRCSARIVYESAGTERPYQWNGERDVDPFRRMSVFDGKSTPIRLIESLNLSYQPYGFELFQIVSDSLINLQERLSAEIQRVQSERPDIKNLFDEDTTFGAFVSRISPATRKEDLDKLHVWDKKAQRSLEEKREERKGLQNLGDQSEIIRNRMKAIVALKSKLGGVQSECSLQNIGTCLKLIRNIKTLKKKLSTRKGKTLEDYDIPEKESDEWSTFIEAGEGYISISQHEKYPHEGDKCVYCQQRLTKTAVRLIALFRALSQEEESTDYENAETEIEEKLDALRKVSFADNFRYEQDDFKKTLQRKTVVASFAALQRADALVQKMADSLDSKKPSSLKPINVSGLIVRIEKSRKKLETETKRLQEAKANVKRRIEKLNREIAELVDSQKLSKYRGKVEKYIGVEKWVSKGKQLLSSELNTKPITDLGKRAWKELISDSFRIQFEKEAKDLDAPEVSLAFHGEYGSQMREKSLEGLDHIERFLSEGEQKAVALADFFAELWIQDRRIPVILDDPATSFDHDRKERIARRIVKESESKQTIVFTHDLMFAHFLHEQVENDKGDLDSEKAAFHNVERTGKIIGQVNTNDYPGSRNFAYHVQKTEESVSRLERLDGEERREGIANAYGKLRKAVEKAVEEKIFGKVVTRWSDQIQMLNVPRATLNKKKLVEAKGLHEEFSRYIEAHDQSNEMIQNTMPDIGRLKEDIKRVKDLVAP